MDLCDLFVSEDTVLWDALTVLGSLFLISGSALLLFVVNARFGGFALNADYLLRVEETASRVGIILVNLGVVVLLYLYALPYYFARDLTKK